MKPKMWLALGAAAVVALLVVLYLASRGNGLHDKLAGKGSASATTVATDVGATTGSAPVIPPAEMAKVMAAGSDVKVLPDGTREYRVGNMIVRDHRAPGSGSDVPFQMPVTQHPSAVQNEQKHKMDPKVIESLKPGLADALASCGRDVPADMRGPKPKMQAVVKLAVVGGKVTVTGADIDLPDVVGGAVEPTKACLDAKLKTIATTAPNEPDMTDYSVTVSMPLP